MRDQGSLDLCHFTYLMCKNGIKGFVFRAVWDVGLDNAYAMIVWSLVVLLQLRCFFPCSGELVSAGLWWLDRHLCLLRVTAFAVRMWDSHCSEVSSHCSWSPCSSPYGVLSASSMLYYFSFKLFSFHFEETWDEALGKLLVINFGPGIRDQHPGFGAMIYWSPSF